MIVSHRGEFEMPLEALLGPFEGGYDNEDETTQWVGYLCRCHGEVVQKSLHITLKKPVTFADSSVGGFG